MIFLQGGGACWSTFCLATESAHKGIPEGWNSRPGPGGQPSPVGIRLHVLYCDGGLHANDRDTATAMGRPDDHFPARPAQPLGSLDVAVRTFPSSSILLTGVSAGGFGTTYALPWFAASTRMCRSNWSNDSGLGLGRPGNPDFIRMLMRDWNMALFIPANWRKLCRCGRPYHRLSQMELAQDHKLRLSMMSYTRDTIIGITFIQPTGFRPATDTAYPACHARQS